MKKRLFILLITCLVLATVLLGGCNNAKRMLGKVNKSVANAKSLSYSLTVTDSGVTVYSYEKTVTVDGDNATVTVDEATLNKDFALEHAVTTSVAPKADQLVMPLGITEDDIYTYQVNGNLFTCVVSQGKFSTMLNSENLLSADDVTVMFVLADGKCQQMVCSYLTETVKTVSITVVCEY